MTDTNWPPIAIATAPIDVTSCLARVRAPSCGAVASFLGIVRDHHAGKRVSALHYEAYRPMAAKVLGAIHAEIVAEFELHAAVMIHRIGELAVGDVALCVVASSPHREAAFEAVPEAVDRIKTRVPIWKHEFYTDGTEAWVQCQHHTHADTHADMHADIHADPPRHRTGTPPDESHHGP